MDLAGHGAEPRCRRRTGAGSPAIRYARRRRAAYVKTTRSHPEPSRLRSDGAPKTAGILARRDIVDCKPFRRGRLDGDRPHPARAPGGASRSRRGERHTAGRIRPDIVLQLPPGHTELAWLRLDVSYRRLAVFEQFTRAR